MNEKEAKRNFKEKKSKLKTKFSTLTDADLNYGEDREQEMLRMVEYKLRKTKKELAFIIDKL
ncbi:MAG: general stress protein CsbD [Bacteroidetes bacterium]|nr:general stress protein CsbD [Bacteroidota bacterium]